MRRGASKMRGGGNWDGPMMGALMEREIREMGDQWDMGPVRWETSGISDQ